MTAPDDLVERLRGQATDWRFDEYERAADLADEAAAELTRLQAEIARISNALMDASADSDAAKTRANEWHKAWLGMTARAERAEASEAEARAKIAEQLIEIGQLQDRLEGYFKRLTRVDGLLANAEAERDSLKADAERYRWLRKPTTLGIGTVNVWSTGQGRYDAWQGDELDAAIDAARKEKPNG